MKNNFRAISIKNSSHNLSRITKWLKINHNFDGTFAWGELNKWGYKTSTGNNSRLVFHFFND